MTAGFPARDRNPKKPHLRGEGPYRIKTWQKNLNAQNRTLMWAQLATLTTVKQL